MRYMTSTALAAVLALGLAMPVFASSCPKEMAAIDAALSKSPKLTPAQLTEVKAQRAKGEEFHKAGKHAESVAELNKAKKTLGIQ
jgi:hypothetical protein